MTPEAGRPSEMSKICELIRLSGKFDSSTISGSCVLTANATLTTNAKSRSSINCFDGKLVEIKNIEKRSKTPTNKDNNHNTKPRLHFVSIETRVHLRLLKNCAINTVFIDHRQKSGLFPEQQINKNQSNQLCAFVVGEKQYINSKTIHRGIHNTTHSFIICKSAHNTEIRCTDYETVFVVCVNFFNNFFLRLSCANPDCFTEKVA